MHNLPLGGSRFLRQQSLQALQVLHSKPREDLNDVERGISLVPIHDLSLSFHEMIVSIGNDSATVAKCKQLISNTLSVLGHLAEKDPCALLKLPRSSDVSSEYHELRDANEDLQLSVQQLTAKTDEQQRTIEQLNARIQQQEAELDAARRATPVIAGVDTNSLVPSHEAIQALIDKYADVKAFTADDAEYIFGMLTFVNEEMETLKGKAAEETATSARVLTHVTSTATAVAEESVAQV